MLDEAEWPALERALADGLRSVQAWRRRTGGTLAEALDGDRRREHYADALTVHERLTSERAGDPAALWHHRRALYGPPCGACGRPLRTPTAALCVACGAPS